MCDLHLPLLLTLCLSLSPSVGATEAQSLRNFMGWIDQFVLSCCNLACLVHDLDGNRLHGLFHHMLTGEHETFEGQLSNLGVWASECQNANISFWTPDLFVHMMPSYYSLQGEGFVISSHFTSVIMSPPDWYSLIYVHLASFTLLRWRLVTKPLHVIGL